MSGTLYMFVDDVEALAGADVEFAWEREEMPYGLFDFGIQDPNGYYVAFAQPV